MPELHLPFAAELPALPEWLATWPWAEAAVIAFGFAWGSLLGSFINVVVHRLPLGESVAGGGSRCPHCRCPIRARDNLPVIGWLLLRGRCRSCQAGIAPAYPLVEALCGLLVATLVATELAAGGRWLPGSSTGFPQGVDRLLRGDWHLLVTCCLHAGVVLTIVTWALLDRSDWKPQRVGSKCPRGWFMLSAGIVLAGVAICPTAAPPGLLPGGAGWPAEPNGVQGVTASLVGMLLGSVLAQAAGTWSVRLALPLLGGVLGWQTLTVVAVATALAAEIVRFFAPGRLQPGDAGLGLAVAGTAALAWHAAVVAVWQPSGTALQAALTTG